MDQLNQRQIIDDLVRQQTYLDENISNIIPIYSGRYVIIYDNKIVDSDEDEFELAKRHEMRFDFDFSRSRAALLTFIHRTIGEYRESRSHINDPPFPGSDIEHFTSPTIGGNE